MHGTKASDAVPYFFELRDPGFGAVEGPTELLTQMWADWLVPLMNVGRSQFFDLFEGQPQRAEAPDHLQAPERGLVEEPVIASTPAKAVNQPQAVVFTQGPDGHSGSPGQLSDRHRFIR